MPEYNNNMRGALFSNDRKTSDNDPNLSGNCEIDGVQYWVSGWIKESQKVTGGRFISLSFKVKEQQSKPAGGGGPVKKVRDEIDDAIPFVTSEGVF